MPSKYPNGRMYKRLLRMCSGKGESEIRQYLVHWRGIFRASSARRFSISFRSLSPRSFISERLSRSSDMHSLWQRVWSSPFRSAQRLVQKESSSARSWLDRMLPAMIPPMVPQPDNVKATNSKQMAVAPAGYPVQSIDPSRFSTSSEVPT